MKPTLRYAFILLAIMQITSSTYAQDHLIDSVDVNYHNNQLDVFVQSWNNGVDNKRRHAIAYYNDSVVAYDIFWWHCDPSLPAIDYEAHEITLDSVPVERHIFIRLYYDTNIVNYDPNDDSGCFYHVSFVLLDSLYLSVEDQASLNIEEQDEVIFEIYPNPVNQILEIRGELTGIEEILVFDNSGKEVLRQKTSTSHHFTIDVRSLENGVYILRCMGSERNYSKRFVKNEE